jgi:hypothetical protein
MSISSRVSTTATSIQPRIQTKEKKCCSACKFRRSDFSIFDYDCLLLYPCGQLNMTQMKIERKYLSYNTISNTISQSKACAKYETTQLVSTAYFTVENKTFQVFWDVSLGLGSRLLLVHQTSLTKSVQQTKWARQQTNRRQRLAHKCGSSSVTRQKPGGKGTLFQTCKRRRTCLATTCWKPSRDSLYAATQPRHRIWNARPMRAAHIRRYSTGTQSIWTPCEGCAVGVPRLAFRECWSSARPFLKWRQTPRVLTNFLCRTAIGAQRSQSKQSARMVRARKDVCKRRRHARWSPLTQTAQGGLERKWLK